MNDQLTLNPVTETPTAQEPQLILSQSALADFLESPKHYYWNRILKRKETTDAMEEGKQLHMLVLEPEKFGDYYFTDMELPKDSDVLRTMDDMKEFLTNLGLKPKGKKADLIEMCNNAAVNAGQPLPLIYDEWIEENTRGKTYISRAKWDALTEMAKSIREHRFAQRYLEFAKKEVEWQSEIFGVPFRGKIDWLVTEEQLPWTIVIDVKKSKSAKWFKFQYTLRDMNLHVQAAIYSLWAEKTFGKPVLFVWLVVEPTAPYICEAYSAPEAVLEAGKSKASWAVKKLLNCLQTNFWGGYSDGEVNNIHLPKDEFDRVAEMELEEEEGK